MDPINASIVAYTSLSAYYILHMIFVIASDFVDVFNIPPLNIGIYIAKLVSWRSLLMVISDIFEWLISHKGFRDPGPYKKLSDFGARRIGSLLSFFAILGCRIGYLVIVYKSDNKSLSVFIVFCIEGFWFGVFQMSFFAISAEFSAFISLGIYTMGDFIFFFQLILNKMANTRPNINSLYRVRVHGWICLVTSVVALILWILLCKKYLCEDSVKPDYVNDMVEALKTKLGESMVTLENATDAAEVFKQLANKMKELFTKVIALVKAIDRTRFSSAPKVTPDSSNKKVTVIGSGSSTGTYTHKVKLSITGSSEGSGNFIALVNKLKEQLMTQSALNADGLHQGLNRVTGEIFLFVQEIESSSFGGVPSVNKDPRGGNKVTVKVKNIGGRGIGSYTKSVTVSRGGSSVEVVFNVQQDSTQPNAKKIANTLALAMVHETVTPVIKEKGYWIELKDGATTVEIEVKNARSRGHAKSIAKLIAKAFEEVSVTGGGTTGPTKIKLSVSDSNGEENSQDTEHSGDTISKSNVLSPLMLFPVGSAVKDFLYPAILPSAYLDTQRVKFVNYLSPAFFFYGGLIVVLLNDFFYPGGFAEDYGNSKFKDWSEGEAPEWNCVWLLNIPIYMSFFIIICSIHGTFHKLRCIVQSRWRVLVLTMFIIIPRATLEVAGYVGVANYALALAAVSGWKDSEWDADQGDLSGFDFIVVHDVLAKFCRFFNGKLAVGYNLTRISVGYCLPEFKQRHKGLGFWFWCGRSISGALTDIVKDFKADIKDYL